MAEINWTVLVVIFIGLFALMGFYKGWWKEGVTTVFLAFLVFLLQMPVVAQFFIDVTNAVIITVWSVLPASIIDFIQGLLTAWPGITATDAPPIINAGAGQTWLVILLLSIAAATLAGRTYLPSWGRNLGAGQTFDTYVVTQSGGLFGALLGALNGWLIVILVRAYLDGRNLPGGGGAVASSSDSVLVQAVNISNSTILDSFLPWIIVGLSLLVISAAAKSRVTPLPLAKPDKDGYRKTEYKAPPGHRKISVSRK